MEKGDGERMGDKKGEPLLVKLTRSALVQQDVEQEEVMKESERRRRRAMMTPYEPI